VRTIGSDGAKTFRLCSLLALDRLQHLEAAHERLVNGHHRSCIVELPTVVGRTENCDELSLREELVAVLHNLVSTNNQVHVVLLQEAAHDVWPEDEGDTAVVLSPTGDVLVWISPQEVANHASVWHVGWAYQAAKLIEVCDLWGQAAVHAHDFLIDEPTDRHAVEDIAELLPHLDVVTSLALVVEAVDACN